MAGQTLLDLVIEPLKDFLLDDSIQEIMVNNLGRVVIEQGHKLFETSLTLSNNQIETLIRVVASKNSIFISKNKLSFSLYIDDIQCRFQGTLPPASSSPLFCIHKLSPKQQGIKTLQRFSYVKR